MSWDDDKSTAADPDNPNPDEQLTADEWDVHVSEGHFPGDELNFGIDGNGDPIVTDPQNGDQVVMRYDRSEGSWVFDSISTDELYNDEEPNLDISKYTAPVISDALVHKRIIDSLDGWNQTTSGSGSISINSVQIDTGSTSGSLAAINERIDHNARIASRDWSKDRYWRTAVNILDSDSSRTDYYGWGGDPTSNEEFVGFKLASGTLQGAVNNASGESTTTLVSSPGTGKRVLRFEVVDGTVEYFVDGTSLGTISSGLPSGAAFAEFTARYRVENSTSAQRRVISEEYQFARAP